MIYSDGEIVEVIEKLINGEGDEDQIAYWLDHELRGIESILDVIFHSKEPLNAKDSLKIARELAKPICL